jgi:hypothetical protein
VINTTGLYLTKHGGAVLNSISFSLLLPITTILFSVPLLGEFRESIFPATYVGIVVLITGFAMWRYFQAQHDALLAELAARESAAAKDASDGATSQLPGALCGNRSIHSSPFPRPMTAAWDQRRGRRDPGVPTSPSHQTLFNLSFKGGAFQYICANYSSAALIYYSSMGHA